ncbi:helix-turn-helix transcriptional regulator [Sphingomonas sp. C3-2]|uniref:helix-turn-helix transcriptional regulator n=1 Tax=Sphingomonas sp. C3-2 TaxID=3062169 RepID=UPI00294B3596|nr:AlpA family phage regulatory protein [Sphingomonas sp. C3-2]WOK35450.1 AlpA family phage regulatory protein [Sphingomonas sp. C3-2]
MQIDRIVRIAEICEITGLSARTIERKVKAGTFPAKRQLSAQCVGWRLSDITAWLDGL